MESVKAITLPDWMVSEQGDRLLSLLNDDGQPPRALYVGGCVRNAVMAAGQTDIDIATSLKPPQVIEICETAGIKVVPTGIDHGTVTAVLDSEPFEITTLRKDIETDGRRAVVSFTDSWVEDAQRRDFTMNTLLADQGGQIYDPLGQGLMDLEARRVVFVGQPEARIKEDYLRILRFFRFHAWYGEGTMDESALKACTDLAPEMKQLSKERITQEVSKILTAPKAFDVLKIIQENNILPNLFHADYKPSILKRYYEFQNPDISAALFILSGLDEGHMEALENIMVLSNAVKKRYAGISSCMNSHEEITEKSVKRMVYDFDNVIAQQVLQIHGEDSETLMGIAQNWSAPTFPITGEQLIKDGYEQGPALGQKLKELEERWIENGFKN